MLIFFAAILQKQILCFWQFYLNYQKKISLLLRKTTLNIYLELLKVLMLHSLINDSVFCKEKQNQKI